MKAYRVEHLLSGPTPGRVLVVSDRYPPDAHGGAELSLHLMLREPRLRDGVLVVTFDKQLHEPARRTIDGVEVLALPSPAAWPLHRLSQAEVEALKRRPMGLKWAGFLHEAAACGLRDPVKHLPALALRFAGAAPSGGVRMAHATIPEGRAPATLRTVIEMVRPRLVHADNARAIMIASEALAGLETPLVALVRDHRFTSVRFDQTSGSAEGTQPGWRGRFAAQCAAAALAYRQASLGRAAAVVATSGHLEATLAGFVSPGRLTRAPLVPIEAPGEAFPPRLADGDFRILVVGSLTSNKGQTHLLEGWRDLAARIPGASIEFAGGGPDKDRLKRLAMEVGAEGRVSILGRVEPSALAARYAACDVVALPTLWAEPFGRVPLEAGAAARPVVSYASGGLAETVIDGVTGRIVPNGDRDAFIAALADLASDPAARLRMGLEGRLRATRDHAPASLADRLASIWNDATTHAAQAIASPAAA